MPNLRINADVLDLLVEEADEENLIIPVDGSLIAGVLSRFCNMTENDVKHTTGKDKTRSYYLIDLDMDEIEALYAYIEEYVPQAPEGARIVHHLRIKLINLIRHPAGQRSETQRHCLLEPELYDNFLADHAE